MVRPDGADTAKGFVGDVVLVEKAGMLGAFPGQPRDWSVYPGSPSWLQIDKVGVCQNWQEGVCNRSSVPKRRVGSRAVQPVRSALCDLLLLLHWLRKSSLWVRGGFSSHCSTLQHHCPRGVHSTAGVLHMQSSPRP